MEDKLKNGLLIWSVAGLLFGSAYFIIVFTLGSFIGNGNFPILEMIGIILIFTIGLPNLIVGQFFVWLGYTSDAYLLHVIIVSNILYAVIFAFFYYSYYQNKTKTALLGKN